jgi:hypothetical protein
MRRYHNSMGVPFEILKMVESRKLERRKYMKIVIILMVIMTACSSAPKKKYPNNTQVTDKKAP